MSFMNMTRNITKGQVASYMLMPQVMPRINKFYQDGFASLAYIIALVYRAVNILPANHPVLRPENRKSLGLRMVLSAAAAELKFTKDNIDKVIVYFVILLGLVLLAVQFFMTLAVIMLNPAWAQTTMPTNYGQFFTNPVYPKDGTESDIAYMMLWSVFGVPEIFNPGQSRSEFHVALHSLFQLYSIGLLVIGVIIVCYFVFAILVETAQTGVPFGKRYNHVWTPIRLVFALGLLIPVGYGLNSAQWITLYSAKFGSDFATKGWVLFNEKMTNSFLSDKEKRVGTPQAPNMMNLAANIMTVNGCTYAYGKIYKGDNKKEMDAYLILPSAENTTQMTLSSTTFEKAKKDFKNGDILVRFGEHSTTKHQNEPGNVFPYCGELVIPAADSSEPGAKSIQEYYYKLVQNMYGGSYQLLNHAQNLVDKSWVGQDKKPDAADPPATYKATMPKQLQEDVEKAIKEAVEAQSGSKTWEKDQKDIRNRGWGGAGIWYNKIAQINGSLISAVNNVPEMRKMPWILEYVKTKKLQENTEQSNFFSDLFLAGKREIPFESNDEIIAKSLIYVANYWYKEDANQTILGNKTKVTNNVFIDVINLIFGTRGLFNMCANADIHPLAQLSVLGKGLIEATIRNIGGALLLSFGSAIGGAVGSAMQSVSSILLSVGTITLTMGFMLFYVLPFMPFLYFFFAVGGWIKGLFEAMIGVPLWALAHLRIDGQGLPGDAAKTGYYLILEIFLRPILIVFGLLASVIIFAAMVKVLNEIFSLVVSNLSGHDGSFKTLCGKASGNTPAAGQDTAINYFRGPIDELFFTVIYAIIVYMIGMSCFKLIDLVPNNILRYMGESVPTFSDKQGDAAEGLMTTLTAGSGKISSQILGSGRGDGVIGGATGVLTNSFKGGIDAVTPKESPKSGGQ